MLNRRTFAQYPPGCLTVLMLPIIGCSTDTIATFVNLIANYASQLATYFGAGSIASQITALAGTIASDISSWQSGVSSGQAAINALNDLEDLINQIPAAASYQVLIDLILGAVAGLLALLPAPLASQAVRAQPNVTRRAVTPTPYPDASKKSMTTATNNLKAAWAQASAGLPLTK
jgi:hypothetical protein